jgi:hypothetical protein
MKTIVVNIYKESYDVYCGRAGKGQDGYFGNPFVLKKGEPRGATLLKYKEYFYKRLETDPEFKRRIHELKGKRLGCFCKPNDCHLDIIVDYLNTI